jgi:unsaturated rhamnogalacturonyl hydrolase
VCSGLLFLWWLKMSVVRFILDYIAAYTDYKTYWNYEDGCVLIGCVRLYEVTRNPAYKQFIMDYLYKRVDKKGAIASYESEQYNIDSINSGKLLFFGLRESGDARFRIALDYHMQRLCEHPRCQNGSFWHKSIYPYQIWLDGLYMAQPFYAEYDMLLGGKAHAGDIVLQFDNVRRFMFDENKQLSYHAYDESRQMFWCDKETGLSPNFWLRSMGWYLMALADTIDLIDEQLYEHKRRLQDIFGEAVRGIMRYQAQNGLFYQLIDRQALAGNYTEASGSAMVAYALMKGARIGALLEEKYAPAGRAVFDALVKNKLKTEEGTAHLEDICLVAGLGGQQMRDGSAEYYLSEPRVKDDAKGVGPFIMACAESLMQDAPPLSRRDR